jgi:uncharacterized membrane protein
MVTELKLCIVVIIVAIVNAIVYTYALFHFFDGYSDVKFMYLAFSLVFFVIADLYDDMNRKLSSIAMHIISILFALKVVF